MNQKIKNKIEEKLKSKIKSLRSVGGGCISDSQIALMESGEKYFLKVNESASGDMFVKEAHGLIELGKAEAIHIPKVISYDTDFILLECIEESGKVKNFFEDFGRKFAQLHKYTAKEFGFYEDNYIGSNPQINVPDRKEAESWTEFYFNKRILYQYKLAEKYGNATSELKEGIKKLENKIDEIIKGSEEPPSLLHGDLWGGNYITDEKGEACLIDPAVYYGHREADLGMTKLFGGFSSAFYNSYNEYFPLKDSYQYREGIYKLYHVLNHLNLFGGGYYTSAMSLIKSYI